MNNKLEYCQTKKRTSKNVHILYSFIENTINESNSSAYNIGFQVLGPLTYGYIKWLFHSLQQCGINKIFFLSREGKFIQECFDCLYPNSGFEEHYLLVSRKSLLNPSLGSAQSFDDLMRVVNMLVHVPTVENIIHECGQGKENEISETLIRAEVPLSSNAYKLDNRQKEALFHILCEEQQEHYETQRSCVLEYLNSENFRGDLAIVDVGWRGTMQRALLNLCPEVKRAVGFYLGVRDDLPTTNYKTIDRRGYYFQDKTDVELSALFRFSDEVLESLFLNPQGSVASYRFVGDVVKPILKESEYSQTMARFFLEVQDAAKSFLLVAKEEGNSLKGLSSIDYASPYYNLVSSPSAKTVAIFKGFSVYEGSIKPMIPPRGLSYYVRHPRDFMEDNNNVPKTLFWKSVFKLNLPYFKILYFLIYKLGMKSSYRKNLGLIDEDSNC